MKIVIKYLQFVYILENKKDCKYLELVEYNETSAVYIYDSILLIKLVE